MRNEVPFPDGWREILVGLADESVSVALACELLNLNYSHLYTLRNRDNDEGQDFKRELARVVRQRCGLPEERPRPCDGCSAMPRCKAEELACVAFLRWTRHGVYREDDRVNPTAKNFAEIWRQ